MRLLKSPRLWGALAAAYWLILLAGTHVPTDMAPSPGDGWDKFVHFAAYGLLALICAIAWRLRWRGFGLREAAAVFLTLSIYGALDECTQPWFGRTCDPADWAADLTGAAAGLIAAFVIIAIFRRPTTATLEPRPLHASLEPSGGR